jgi:acetyltransferase-like isoleucine patch superfamily enzyme
MRAICYSLFFKKMGKLCYLGKPLFLKGLSRVSFGARVRIYPHLRMEVITHYKKAQILIEDEVSAGQNLHLISAGMLKIGRGTLLSSNIMITNVNHKFEDISKSVTDQSLEVKDVCIGENCFIGFGSIIMPGSQLGNHCIVGANSVVKGKFGDHCVIVGNPAKVIKKYNKITKKWERVV